MSPVTPRTTTDAVPRRAADPELRDVAITICAPCLAGEGGECHSPGCLFFICPAPDAEQAERIRSSDENANAYAELRARNLLALALLNHRACPNLDAEDVAAVRGALLGEWDA